MMMILRKWYGGWETSYSVTSLKKLMISNGFKVVGTRYRGIFPHRWEKLIFPKKISNEKIKQIFTTIPFKYFHQAALYLYKNFRIVRLFSSYNVIVIAKKK